MTVITDIKFCIAEMLVAKFFYKGSWRSVEPHLLGVTTAGNLCLSAFQLNGGSAQDWRAFLIDEIADFSITTEHFDGPRDGYNPNDSLMTNVMFCI